MLPMGKFEAVLEILFSGSILEMDMLSVIFGGGCGGVEVF